MGGRAQASTKGEEMSGAYYNEIDPKAAAWLRELIKQGHIADGIVDERSIVDVKPEELREFTQCHFFAGIGVWSYALRRAGWEDGRPVWTGSCPCQPFSAAGKGNGFADERHLWPAFFHLIENVRPVTVFGEQVASKDGLGWLDLVQADLEGKDYAFGAIDTCAAGFGAPHIRQRLYWVADSGSDRGHDRRGLHRGCAQEGERGETTFGSQSGIEIEGSGTIGGLADRRMAEPVHAEWRSIHVNGQDGCHRENAGREETYSVPRTRSKVCGMGNAADQPRERRAGSFLGTKAQEHGERVAVDGDMPVGFEYAGEGVGRPASGPTNGFWRDADWLYCRDGKWRPVEPSTFPLAHGASARVGRLRGYGNAINAAQAEGFITAFMEVRP